MFAPRFLRNIGKIQKPEEAERFLRHDRYWIPEVAERLLNRVDELAQYRPSQSVVEIGQMGVDLVGRIRNATSDLRVHALCSLGGAQRTSGLLSEADATLARADPLEPSCTKPIRAMLARQKAVIRMNQARADEALALAKSAVSLDRSTGVVPVKSLLVEGFVRFVRGEYELSSSCWKEILEKDSPSSAHYTFAMQNLVATLARQNISAKDIVPLRDFMKTVQERIKGTRGTPVRYITWHTEGILHALVGEYRFAIKHFLQAQQGFLRTGQLRDYVLVTPDLIDAYLRRSDGAKTRKTLERAIKVLAGEPRFAATVELFQRAIDVPLSEVVAFLREQTVAALAQQSEGASSVLE